MNAVFVGLKILSILLILSKKGGNCYINYGYQSEHAGTDSRRVKIPVGFRLIFEIVFLWEQDPSEKLR